MTRPVQISVPGKLLRAFVSIEYDEAPDTYRGVRVEAMRDTGPAALFNSGDPVLDWREAMLFASRHYDYWMGSSSCDHFVMDQPGFRYDENTMLVRDMGEAA